VTTIYVARHLGEDTSVLSFNATVGTIVGGDTALDTHDGDTSYVVMQYEGGLVGTARWEMPFRWERISGPVPTAGTVTSITVEGAMRRDPLSTAETAAFASFYAFEVGGATGSIKYEWIIGASQSDTWKDKSSSLSTTLLDYFGDDHIWRISPNDPALFRVQAFRITYLRAVIEAGVPPLRQRNRDETRARLLPSRQRSIRARGYL
jgi:hypothetical protein